MKQTKRVLFTFSPYEYKGVEVYLNSLAARGWELVKVGSVLASFRRTQRTDLTYCTDLLTYRRRQGGREAQREYLALCREGGWELVDRRGSMGLFASLPGTNPAPIQTDRDTEWYHYKRAYRNSLFWAVAAILPMLCLVLIILLAGGLATAGEALIRAFRFTWQRSWVIAIWQAALPVLFAAGLWKIGGFFWSWGKTRRSGAIHTPARRDMWANAVVNLIELAALLLMAAASVADLIQGRGSVASVVGLATGGVILFFWPSFTYQDEVYPREYRQVRIYGAGLVVIAVLVIGATWWYGGDTVYFWRDNDDFLEYYAPLEEMPVVRETDVGAQPEGAYTLSQGIGPAGRYTLLMMSPGNNLDEVLDGVSCSRYDCWFPWLAGQVADTLREEVTIPEYRQYRDWVNRDYQCGELEPISLGWADEAWLGTWRDYNWASGESRGHVLVLRKGNVAVRVFAPVNLTDRDILAAIRSRSGF